MEEEEETARGGGNAKGNSVRLQKAVSDKHQSFWLAGTWPPFRASWDLLPNHKIECAFLLLIIFLSSSRRFLFVMSVCMYVLACLIALVLTSTDVAEGRYIKGDPLKGYYDFIITGKSLCVFLFGDKCVSALIQKKPKWKEDCDKCVGGLGQFYPFGTSTKGCARKTTTYSVAF